MRARVSLVVTAPVEGVGFVWGALQDLPLALIRAGQIEM
jgi:hypothetical protein